MAQQQASLRFAGAQLMNFTQRLEQLRSPQRQAFQNGLQLAMPRAGNNSIRNCQNLPSLLGQQECIARQGMDSRASLAPSWSRAARQDAVAATQGLTAEQAYATSLEGNGSATSATLGGAQRTLAQRAAALAAGGQAGAPHTPQVYADEPLPAPGSAERPRLAYWTAGMLDWGFADATQGQDDGMRFTTSGVTLGVDYLVNSEWTVGMGVGFAYDRSTLGSDGSRNHSKGVSTALYGSWSPAPAYFVDGVLGYSRLRFDSRRWVADAGDYALGERDGTQWFASVSAGYEWRSPQMMLSPYGRLQWARSSLDGYTETGAGWHALRFEQQRLTSSSASLGLRGETNHDTSWGQLLPFGRLELQHDFDGQSDVRFGYADLNGLSSTGYAINSSPIGRNRVQIGMGSRLQSRMGTFAAELQFTRSNTSFQRGLRLSYTTRY
ncbi:MAG: autotransporter outer membrane beta-barrel domain-containing protein, partial [Acidovorax sp.]|jgi:outer membrane autotransporter protein|nr:autotransporter outer membrane beta-barrel domain-containing protein [Acidovorax sp.]